MTLFSLLLAYPLAYLLAFKVKRHKQLMYMAVIIPLWVSYLVRAYAWKIILGQEGILNGLLAGGRADRPAAHLSALQPLGGDPGADPHLHAVHADADLRRARGDPARAQGGEPGPLRQPVADLPPDRAAALAARRAGGLAPSRSCSAWATSWRPSSSAGTTARSWSRTWSGACSAWPTTGRSAPRCRWSCCC